MYVLLVDDHPIVRFGFSALLKQLGDHLIFLEANNAQEAIDLALQFRPHVALVDLTLAGTLNLELIKRLAQKSPETAILVVSMHEESTYAERALRAGARGYVMKQIAAKSIVQAVESISKGKIWLSEEFREKLIQRTTSGVSSANENILAALSDREATVFRLIGLGMKKAEIAQQLHLSPNTVETYRTSIKQKLGVRSGGELYKLAFVYYQNECLH
jgi:DNA-binding NarL/FixJ family response regulator